MRENSKKVLVQSLMVGALCLFFGSSVFAQGFPWDIFKPRTINEAQAITTKAFRPDDSSYLATNLLESKAEVIFTGKFRPIDPARKDFIKIWAGMVGQDKTYPDVYLHEYLYKEGDVEYWLPTQEPVTKYFDKELKPGDKMILFFISIGAYNKQFMEAMNASKPAKDFDCVLLVEEYQLPKPLAPKTDK